MRIYQLTFIANLIFVGATAVSCGTPSRESDAADTSATETAPPAPPVVSDTGKNLLFSWFEENEAKTATAVTDIPDGVKKEVRVQDLSIPPDKRNPEWLFLADLTQKDANGNYSVRAVQRRSYEDKRHPSQKPTAKNEAAGATTGNATTGNTEVIMYSTAHCPHCKRARRWLLEQKIPYKEIDIEKDGSAAMALHQKCQDQGVPPGGVPMFEINGQLLPGFVPEAIRRMLNSPASKTAPSPPPPHPKQTAPSQAPSTNPVVPGNGQPSGITI